MSPLRRDPPPGGWIRQRTKVCGSRYCVVMAGGVNCGYDGKLEVHHKQYRKPLWPRLRSKPDYTVCQVPWTDAHLEGRQLVPGTQCCECYSETLHGSFDTEKHTYYIFSRVLISPLPEAAAFETKYL